MKIEIELSAASARRIAVVGVTLILAAAGTVALAVPVQFEDDEVLTASQLNDNFANLESRVAGLEAKRWALTGVIAGGVTSNFNNHALTQSAHSSLTMQVSTGAELQARIPCTGAAPNGLACATTDEVFGVSFLPPSTSQVRACFFVPYLVRVNDNYAYGNLLLDLVETSDSDPTPTSVAKNPFAAAIGYDSSATRKIDSGIAILCEEFTATAGQRMTVRVRDGLSALNTGGATRGLEIGAASGGSVGFEVRPL